ncbi:MAG TPA: hypothetical protein ENK11_07425, partial [Phycisphaerales bacterium]|nr:hypothetical protein [Phycisphaerales bacterium]
MRIFGVLLSVFVCLSAMADELSQSMALGVSRVSLQQLDVSRDGEGRAMVSVALDGREVVLDLEPYSARAEGFRLVLDLGGGVLKEVPAPAPRTVRGVVVGEPGSVAA